ncbi:bifunctional tetrahydrofolate synthase/dihydrofolate synthase [Saccharospirillum sp.]|uniref:bifunctional tetrahydrofolate synthase/dihydrofolate synthase n=1 Tax=Saccharospirillum sp. TaxID=2033801 RepID=UPI0034A02A7A
MCPQPDASLDDWLRYLEHLHSQAIDMGLDRLLAVALRLDLPLGSTGRRRPFVFTVAGTNGKGSTCETLRQLSLAAGCRVGLYTSPHLHLFNERVQIDASPVTDACLIAAFKQVELARGDITLTYFEFTTLAAFVVFQAADLDVWVLEVGLGGRLDAVNLVDPDVAVVTTVDLDHAAFLGTDRDQIGVEKAGIFRSGTDAVLGSDDLPETVASRADALGAPVWSLGISHGADESGLWWTESTGIHRLDAAALTTTVPPDNLVSARQAFARSPFQVTDAQTLVAFNAVIPAGRLQKIQALNCDWILDVGHNPHAARYLARRLGDRRWHVLLGMLADKDVEAVTRALAPMAASWSLATLSVPRGLTATELNARATVSPARCYDSVAAAVAAAPAEAEGLPILVCGSFFTVAEALTALTQ